MLYAPRDLLKINFSAEPSPPANSLNADDCLSIGQRTATMYAHLIENEVQGRTGICMTIDQKVTFEVELARFIRDQLRDAAEYEGLYNGGPF